MANKGIEPTAGACGSCLAVGQTGSMKKRLPRTQSRGRATGVVAANPHEGSRSEILADYLFSGWGTVTPVRRQDDFGVDLYCTLTDRIGKRAVVTDYFTVQVKSTNDPGASMMPIQFDGSSNTHNRSS